MTDDHPRVRGFDSFEQMMEQMAADEAAANQALESMAEEIRNISYGDYFLRITSIADCPFLFGYVFTQEELKQGEMDAGADEHEASYTMRRKHESHQRGYRTGVVYSPVTPQGEYGDTHLSNISWPLTKEDLDKAKELGWARPAPETYSRILQEMEQALERDGKGF